MVPHLFRRRVPRGVAMVEYFLKTQPEDVDEAGCLRLWDGLSVIS